MFEEIVSALSGNLFKGVSDIIKTFVKDPTEALKAEHALLTLQVETGRKLAELEVQDRQSARQREVETKDPTTRRLAYLYTSGYFGMLAALLSGYVTVPTDMKGLLDVLMGVLTAGQYSVMSYYFGSSHGSETKTALLGRMNGNGPK